tara:strand:+ start:5451 stop:6491 length:1041 start_codon:yes stop_codon:yes gene_type:complete
MKKNLRNILALALGLMTTVSFAQDWNVDSRTRIDMSGDMDKMSTSQRVTVGTAWGGSDWGIVLSSDVNYTTNEGTEVNAEVYEAYATTNLFGFATMNIGRQALSYGSGVFVGTNDWSANRNTVDGMTFAVDNDFVGLDLGLNNDNDGAGNGTDRMWLNASKSSGDWSANLFYSAVTANEGNEANQMGLDFAYTAMGGALTLDVSYNTTANGVDEDGDMMDVSGTYTVNDDMSLTAGRTSVGENGFTYGAGGNMSGDWMSNGNLGALSADQENMYIGGSYNMGAFSLGATMHTVTNTTDDTYERKATEVSVGYSLGDNAALSYKMVTDNNGGADDTNYNWLTLTVTP